MIPAPFFLRGLSECPAKRATPVFSNFLFLKLLLRICLGEDIPLG